MLNIRLRENLLRLVLTETYCPPYVITYLSRSTDLKYEKLTNVFVGYLAWVSDS